jgi:hypothetical protein
MADEPNVAGDVLDQWTTATCSNEWNKPL